MSHPKTRRAVLAGGAGLGLLVALRPAAADQVASDAAIRTFAGKAEIKPGRVKLDIPPLVENGNAVALTVTAESAMTETEHVRRIAVFNTKNPQPNVIVAHLGPRAGRPVVSTRIRLGDSQRLTAIAEMSDGTFWSGSADVIVTLAACLEG
jgi:sulfur-oxidizing protein SoxY